MSTKKEIAIVLDSMNVGGVEKSLIEMLKGFDYHKFSVTLFLKDGNGPFQNLIPDNVNILYYGVTNPAEILKESIRKLRIAETANGILNRILARINFDQYDLNAYYSARALPYCSKKKFDCVIAYQVLSPLVVATALHRIHGEKNVLFVHGRNIRSAEVLSFFDRVYNRFDKVFCVSEKTRADFSRDFPLTSPKTAVMYNLLDSKFILQRAREHCEIQDEGVSLVTVGRLVSIKGQQMVPQTVRMLLDAGYDIRWYLVGDGPLRGEIEAEIQKYAVSDRVILLGTKENPYPYIKNCDIYVQPSFSEGYCTTTMEAKVLCKPVVTTDAPGMREQFVSGENGLIVDAMAPEALFEGIRTLLDHPELCRKFEEKLRQESFDDAANAKELQKLYDFIES